MVLFPSLINKEYFCCLEFDAKVWMLHSNTTILRKGLQVTICVASTMQNASVVEVKDEVCNLCVQFLLHFTYVY